MKDMNPTADRSLTTTCGLPRILLLPVIPSRAQSTMKRVGKMQENQARGAGQKWQIWAEHVMIWRGFRSWNRSRSDQPYPGMRRGKVLISRLLNRLATYRLLCRLQMHNTFRSEDKLRRRGCRGAIIIGFVQRRALHDRRSTRCAGTRNLPRVRAQAF